MFLKTVLVRFYKSFNFDYLRKFDVEVTRHFPWESVNDLWYPYVQIPIDSKITTVVGANESGKTHLLTAIEKGVRGAGIVRDDFCRHSQFFTVEDGKMRWPDFGFEWAGLNSEERQSIAKACEITTPVEFDKFFVFRTDRNHLTAFFPKGTDFTQHSMSGELQSLVPNIFRLHEDIALPESAPIRFLAGDDSDKSSLEQLPRKRRVELFESILGNSSWFDTKETVTKSADNIVSAFSGMSSHSDSDESSPEHQRTAELCLARDLIRKVAKIDAQALQELLQALRDGKDAFANSLVDAINSALNTALNFPHWWVQDKEFRLLVSPRDYDLVFTILDRTGREYSFGERSSGLKYFLSYYIQYLAHEAPENAESEILLMDEPDAYLSSQGQQDLLKLFDAFANPEDTVNRVPTQVVYVTHSPFLIDKNHGERIRVLEKGVGEEGTRVVRDASRNHYEPLRSAFGSFVAETTFIGHCNLMVEGPADQILLAGAASHLRSRGASELETLDLNKITIVPAGGEGHIPYLVYLARGRDIEKPAVIVLLDSDEGGNNAKKGLQRGGAKRKQVLRPEHVIQIGAFSEDPYNIQNTAGHGMIEIEDLIPMAICVGAARRYLKEFCGVSDAVVLKLNADLVLSKFVTGKSIFDALKESFASIDEELHVEKIGFARMTLETVAASVSGADNDPVLQKDVVVFEDNMKVLFRKLRKMQRKAERELTEERVSQRVERTKQAFLQDHPKEAKREHAFVLLEDIEACLDNSLEGDEIRTQIHALRRDFKIDDDVTEPVPDYENFKERLEHLKYAGRLASQEPEAKEAKPKPSTENADEKEAQGAAADTEASTTAKAT